MPGFAPMGVLLAGFAGLSDLLGSALVLGGQTRWGRWLEFLLPLGTGFVLAIALGELLPAGLEQGRENSLWALAGFSTLYLVSRLFESEEPAAGGRGTLWGLGLTLVGVAICDFFDGVVVASGVATPAPQVAGVESGGSAVPSDLTGLLLLAGLFPHNFLEGSGIALLLLGGGVPRTWAWVLVSVLATASLVGGVAVTLALGPALMAAVRAFASGLLLHLVASQRIPAFTGSHARLQAVLVVAGIGAFVVTEALLGLAGLEA